MKKLITMIGVGLLGIFGMQAAHIDPAQMKLVGPTPEFKQVLSQKLTVSQLEAETVNRPERVQKRVWQSGNYIYAGYLQKIGKLTEVLALTGLDGNLMTHEDVPFYAVRFLLYRYPKGSTIENYDSEIDAVCSWPTYRTWRTTDVDPAVSSEMVPLDEFVHTEGTVKTFRWNNYSQVTSNLFPSVDQQDNVVTFPIWSNIMPELTSTYQGTGNLTFTSAGSRYTNFVLETYDEEKDNTMLIPFDFYFSNDASCSGRYNGPVELRDIVRQDFQLNLSNIHIYNGGIISSESNPNYYEMPFSYPEESWAPVRQFYIYAVSDNTEVIIDSQNQEVPFDSQLLKLNFTCAPTEVSFLSGALFSDKDVTKPFEQAWALVEPQLYYDQVYEMDFYLMNPYPGAIPTSGLSQDRDFYPWSYYDGLVVAIDGYEKNPYIFSIKNGTTEGLLMRGADMAENTYNLDYTGKIIYHYDAKNMKLTEELESVGTMDPNAAAVNAIAAEEGVNVIARNGAISVVADRDAQVAIYTLDGAVVANGKVVAGETYNVNVNKGLYLVKVGKKACKVVL